MNTATNDSFKFLLGGNSKLIHLGAMIIECPTCNAKFRLDESRLNGVSDPQFQCSRCKAVFSHSIPILPLKELTIEKANDSEWRPLIDSTNLDSFEAADEFRMDAVPSARQMSLLPEEPKVNHSKSGRGYLPKSEQELEEFKAEWPSEKALEKELPPPIKAELQSTQISRGALREKPAEFKEPLQASLAPESRSSIGIEREKKIIKTIPKRNPLAVDFRTQEGPESFSYFQKSSLLPRLLPAAKQLTPLLQRSFHAVSMFTPVFIFTSLPLLVCFFCFSLSQQVVEAKDDLPTFTHMFQPGNLSHAPPEGISLSDVLGEVIRLESGEFVLQISGGVVNGTTGNFKDVVVEAEMYNEHSELLGAVQVSANNALSGTRRIQPYAPDFIRSAQQKMGVRNISLKPSEVIPFRMVVLQNAETAQWFGVRIYSVQSISQSGS